MPLFLCSNIHLNGFNPIVISHPHIDHTMKLMDVMQTFTVKNLIDCGQSVGSGIKPLSAMNMCCIR